MKRTVISIALGVVLTVASGGAAHAAVIPCEELAQFLSNLAIARAVQPTLSAPRARQILHEDSAFNTAEKRVLSKYIERAFAVRDPAQGAFVKVDAADCRR